MTRTFQRKAGAPTDLLSPQIFSQAVPYHADHFYIVNTISQWPSLYLTSPFAHVLAHAQQYCFWGRFTTGAPFYGAAVVSQFLGTDGRTLSALDDGTRAIAACAVYASSGAPLRALLYNSAYFVAGSGSRSSETVSLTLAELGGSVRMLRMTAPGATARADQGAAVTIGGGQTSDGGCGAVGQQVFETVSRAAGAVSVSVQASEAVIVYF